MVIEPLIMPEFPEELEDGYEYKSVNWTHAEEFKKDGWEHFGHTPQMQFLVARRKIENMSNKIGEDHE